MEAAGPPGLSVLNIPVHADGSRMHYLRRLLKFRSEAQDGFTNLPLTPLPHTHCMSAETIAMIKQRNSERMKRTIPEYRAICDGDTQETQQIISPEQARSKLEALSFSKAAVPRFVDIFYAETAAMARDIGAESFESYVCKELSSSKEEKQVRRLTRLLRTKKGASVLASVFNVGLVSKNEAFVATVRQIASSAECLRTICRSPLALLSIVSDRLAAFVSAVVLKDNPNWLLNLPDDCLLYTCTSPMWKAADASLKNLMYSNIQQHKRLLARIFDSLQEYCSQNIENARILMDRPWWHALIGATLLAQNCFDHAACIETARTYNGIVKRYQPSEGSFESREVESLMVSILHDAS